MPSKWIVCCPFVSTIDIFNQCRKPKAHSSVRTDAKRPISASKTRVLFEGRVKHSHHSGSLCFSPLKQYQSSSCLSRITNMRPNVVALSIHWTMIYCWKVRWWEKVSRALCAWDVMNNVCVGMFGDQLFCEEYFLPQRVSDAAKLGWWKEGVLIKLMTY